MAKALCMGNKDVQFRQVSNLISHLISNKSTGEEPCLENKMQVSQMPIIKERPIIQIAFFLVFCTKQSKVNSGCHLLRLKLL